MFSLQRLFGKEKTFLGLLERAAEESLRCAEALQKLLANPGDSSTLSMVQSTRLANKRLCEEVSELVVKTFVTSLDREDIETLASALYKLPKPMVKFAERYHMFHQHIDGVSFKEQAEIVHQAATIVVSVVRELGKGNNLELVKELNNQIQQAEANADSLENRLLQNLFSTDVSALKALMVKDLHAMLERAVDRCRDVGSIVSHIVLKNS